MRRTRRMRPRAPTRRRHGMATLLVLVALSAAVVLTVSFASSRQGATAVGQNAASTSAAETAAKAGAEIARAILETDNGWQSDADPDVLYKEFGLNNAKVSIYATTAQGGAPSSSEQDVLITSRANVNGVDAVFQRVVRYQTSRNPGQAIDPYMDEFALYATNKLSIESTCTVARWAMSPVSRVGKPVKVGLGFTTGSDLTIDPSATVPGMALYTVPGASSSMTALAASTRFVPSDALPLIPRAIAAAMPSSINSLSSVGGNQNIDGVSATRAQGRYDSFDVKNSGVLTLGTSGATTLYNINNLNVDAQGVLVIQGIVRMGVRGDMNIKTRGCIELAPGARLTIYLGKAMDISDAAVGFDRSIARNVNRSLADVMGYAPPGHIAIVALSPASGGSNDKNHVINTRAIVRANIHTPYDKPTIDNNSILFGRVTGKDIAIKRSAAVFYDPALDRNMGYTTRTGPLYTSAGAPVNNLTLALSLVGDISGCEVLPGVVAGLCPNKPTTVVSTGATARAGGRAQSAEWPFVAFALEKNPLSDRKTGLFIPPVSDARLTTYATKIDNTIAEVAP